MKKTPAPQAGATLKKVFLKPGGPGRPPTAWKPFGNLNDHWIWLDDLEPGKPAVVLFRRILKLESPLKTRIHISADQRFELSVNGEALARGPELGGPEHWFVHTYDLALPAGEHSLLVKCWWIGGMAPLAQMTRGKAGFLLVAEGDGAGLLTTGLVAWEVAELRAYRFKRPWITWGTQADTFVEGAWLTLDPSALAQLPWRLSPVRQNAGKSFQWGGGASGLEPSGLPDMLHQARGAAAVRHAEVLKDGAHALEPLLAKNSDAALASAMSGLLSGGRPIVVPARTCVQWLLDFEDYLCAYPQVQVRGGGSSRVQIHWAESLYHPPHSENRKGNRSEVEGKIIHADGDSLYPDGRPLSFDLLWWRAGRFVQLLVETGDEPLTLERVSFFESRYPLKVEGSLAVPDAAVARALPLMRRALESCMHETYMDCPYYEQLMYAGDTRTEVLATFAISRDDRLPRKALQCFDWSRLNDGMTLSRYPSVPRQVIPPFSLWWVCMAHDFLMWRDDSVFVRSLMPGVRAVLDGFERYRADDGLLRGMPGWLFVDWSGKAQVDFTLHVGDGASALLNLQYALALQAAAVLEKAVGAPEMAGMYEARAQALCKAVARRFWCRARGLFATDEKMEHFSEHTQALAVLAGCCDEARLKSVRAGLLAGEGLDQATIYFVHYLFEALPQLGAMPLFFEKLKVWTELPEQGFCALPEAPEPARSDCHAWGAHPLYHIHTKLLGITPAAPGFASVRIEPRPCQWRKLSGALPHPRGSVRVALDLDKQRATVELPEGVSGLFVWRGKKTKLHGGKQILRVVAPA